MKQGNDGVRRIRRKMMWTRIEVIVYEALMFLVVFTFIAVLLMSTGCAEWQAVKSGVRDYGSQYEDEKLKVAEFGICEAARVGTVLRHYGGRMEEWALFCENRVPNADELSNVADDQPAAH